MEAIEFQGQDKDLLKAAPGTEKAVYDLPVKRFKDRVPINENEYVDMPAIASCWFFTDEEIEQLITNKVIWFTAWGHSHPPVRMSLEKPF